MSTLSSQNPSLPTLPALLSAPGRPFIHRDLSWLQFNERVLFEAQDKSNPLLERVKFLAISSSNLDEFFMIRFASLNRSIAAAQKKGPASRVKELMRIRGSIFEQVQDLHAKQGKIFGALKKELAAHQIQIVLDAQAGEPAYAAGLKLFKEKIFPQLRQQERFNPKKLYQLGNLELALVFSDQSWFAVPKSLSGAYCVREGETAFVFLLDDLLRTHVGPAFEIEGEPACLRFTRDGDFTVDLEEEDTESIPDLMRTRLRTREKGRPIRIQHLGARDNSVFQNSLTALKLPPHQLIAAPETLCLHGLWGIISQLGKEALENPKLAHPPIKQLIPKVMTISDDIFEVIRGRDLLLHHPYDAFDAFVEWIKKACADPNVTDIDLTVYRMDAVSPIISVLKKSAKTKTIRVIIELRARFDELNNLRLADELRTAGVNVGFGFGQLKVHAKFALITRVENSKQVLYTHLSTGNYNSITARQYTDLAVLTARPEIGQDAKHFFDTVMAGEVPSQFKVLVPAPTRLHKRLLQHIEAETRVALDGKPARIVAKVNALVDEGIIESLYRASQAGVKIDLIVRGACSLIPGVKGLSENIRVICIIDRFLEHSRIYFFEGSKAMYLSSADWMPRNFFSRLEVAFPILDERLYRYIEQIVIPAYFDDTVKGRKLTPEGTWIARSQQGKKRAPVRSQFYFQDLAANEYRNTPLEKI